MTDASKACNNSGESAERNTPRKFKTEEKRKKRKIDDSEEKAKEVTANNVYTAKSKRTKYNDTAHAQNKPASKQCSARDPSAISADHKTKRSLTRNKAESNAVVCDTTSGGEKKLPSPSSPTKMKRGVSRWDSKPVASAARRDSRENTHSTMQAASLPSQQAKKGDGKYTCSTCNEASGFFMYIILGYLCLKRSVAEGHFLYLVSLFYEKMFTD